MACLTSSLGRPLFLAFCFLLKVFITCSFYEAVLLAELVYLYIGFVYVYATSPIHLVMYVPRRFRHVWCGFNISFWLQAQAEIFGYHFIDLAESYLYDYPRPWRPPDQHSNLHLSSRRRRYTRNHHRTHTYCNRRKKASSIASQAINSMVACSSTTSTFRKPPTFDADSFQILYDPGASFCISNDKAQFIGPLKKVRTMAKGIGNAMCTHVGTVRWNWDDDHGVSHSFDIPNTFYCPASPFCLLSPQHLARERNDHSPYSNGTGGGEVHHNQTSLFWDQRRYQRTIPITSETSNVGFITSSPGFKTSASLLTVCCVTLPPEPVCLPATLIPDDDSTTGNDGDSIPHSQPASTSSEAAELFRLPQDLHRPSPVQGRSPTIPLTFMNEGDEGITIPQQTEIPVLIEDEELELEDASQEMLRLHYKFNHVSCQKLQKMAANGDLPKRLATCRLPKCTACLYAKSTKLPWRGKSPANRGKLRTATQPCEVVSVDQIESSVPGLIAQLRGFITKQRYQVVTVFTDHFTNLSYVHVQRSTSVPDTLAAKQAFELFAKSYGHTVGHYHFDNGAFAFPSFRKACEVAGQTFTYSAVNAHFQNGKSEKRNRDLQDAARTMLVHANHRWPEAINANLWPYAIRMANFIHQVTPDKSGVSPLDRFTQSEVKTNLKHLHHFGCPAYVHSVEDGKKGSKWSERARCGIYLGPSPHHARNVSLVLSLETGLVSPQFHVVHDDLFETVRKGKAFTKSLAGFMPQKSNWQSKCYFTKESKPNPIKKSEGVPPPSQGTKLTLSTPSREPSFIPTNISPSEPPSIHPPAAQEPSSGDNPAQTDHPVPPSGPPTVLQPSSGVQTRSGRTVNPPVRFQDYVITMPAIEGEVLHPQDPDWDIEHRLSDPIAFAASSDPDTLYLHEAMREEDWPKFQDSMLEEIRAHEENGHWELLPASDVPEGTKILGAVWSMKRKRRIATREVYKHKSRITVDGSQQVQDENFWDTYSPVVSWFSIRTFLIISLIRGWHRRQIDFILAYPQADVECDMYMEIPRGFEYQGSRKSHVLKLIKNLYGSRQGGLVWNRFIHQGLMERGYNQSQIDKCVYFKGSTVFLLYVDDGIFMGPDSEEITALIASLKGDELYNTKYNITDEGDVDDYLGVKFSVREDGRIELTQPHLIQSILDDLGLKEESTKKETPGRATIILDKDEEGEDFAEGWKYRTVIGKLNFLEKSSRPDITTQVHQCARFSSCPKKSHGEAVKHIGRYLLATKERGIIFDPKDDSFECWADASFCGEWQRHRATSDPSTARSRIGYVVKYGGCPLIWQSKLATEICLSTTECEYVSLSTALREVICIMQLLAEAAKMGIQDLKHLPTVHCKAFEDNSGALEMAKVPKMRPRTKFLNVKYHHFRDFVSRGLISLYAVPTELQQGDMFTKCLPKPLFVKFRQSIMGW